MLCLYMSNETAILIIDIFTHLASFVLLGHKVSTSLPRGWKIRFQCFQLFLFYISFCWVQKSLGWCTPRSGSGFRPGYSFSKSGLELERGGKGINFFTFFFGVLEGIFCIIIWEFIVLCFVLGFCCIIRILCSEVLDFGICVFGCFLLRFGFLIFIFKTFYSFIFREAR